MQFAFEISPGKQFKRRSRYSRERGELTRARTQAIWNKLSLIAHYTGVTTPLSLEHATAILPINDGNNTARRLNAMHYACGEQQEIAICKRKGFSSSGGFVSFGNYYDSHMAGSRSL